MISSEAFLFVLFCFIVFAEIQPFHMRRAHFPVVIPSVKGPGLGIGEFLSCKGS